MNRRHFAAWVSVAAVSSLTGCIGRATSSIEKGERVETGRRLFDSYFEEVADLRDAVEKLDSDLFPVRQPLVEELTLSVDVALGDLLDATKTRVQKMRDFGVSMTLQLRPTPRVIQEQGDRESDDKQETLIKAIEESANRAMQIYTQYAELLDTANALGKKRSDLADRIDKLPPTIDKDLVEREIVGAGVVIRDAETKLVRDTRTITHFVVGLVASVDTGATETYETKCAEAIASHANDKKTPAPKPKPRWRPPQGGTPRPGPKPRPKPAGGDFEM